MNLKNNHVRLHEDLVDALSVRLNAETKELLALCQAFYQHENMVSCIREAVLHYSLKVKRDASRTVKQLEGLLENLKTLREASFGDIQDKHNALMKERAVFLALIDRIDAIILTFKQLPTRSNVDLIAKCLRVFNNAPAIK